jgi:citrate synthase
MSDLPTFLSAPEAAAELGVSLPTLYAYVSRGMIRAEPDGTGRTKRYRADDVRALRARRAPADSAFTTSPGAPILQWGAPALDTAIATIGPHGPIYRGALALDLAAHATLEHVATLLWDAPHDPFLAADLDDPKIKQMESILADGPCIDRAGAMMAIGAALDRSAFSRAARGQCDSAARILKLMIRMITGQTGSAHQAVARAWSPDRPESADLARRALVLLADHELNASTFAARVAASTGASLYDAVAAGLATLKGPRHGGAGLRASRLVESFASRAPHDEARERASLGESFPGFGHQLYPAGDPRAAALLDALAAAGAPTRLTHEGPSAVEAAIGVKPNIDYATAVMAQFLDWPAGAPLGFFALARTAGWLAHAIEQGQRREIIRPRARYTGLAPQ